jgi:hypothetical protein
VTFASGILAPPGPARDAEIAAVTPVVALAPPRRTIWNASNSLRAALSDAPGASVGVSFGRTLSADEATPIVTSAARASTEAKKRRASEAANRCQRMAT